MTDCFGIEISEEEFENWQTLTSGGFSEKGSNHYGFVIPESPLARDGFIPKPEFFSFTLPVTEDDLRNKTIMELGCGSGVHAREIVSRDADYIGIDISRHALDCANMTYELWGNMRFLHTVDDQDEIADMVGGIDGIYGTNFFIHQPDDRMEKMVGFVAKMLAPGGFFSVDRRIGPMRNLGPEQIGTDWRGFQRTRDEEEALIIPLGLELSYYYTTLPVPPWTVPLREYAIYRKPNNE